MTMAVAIVFIVADFLAGFTLVLGVVTPVVRPEDRKRRSQYCISRGQWDSAEL